MEEKEFLKTVISLTGLPAEALSKDMSLFIKKMGKDPEHLQAGDVQKILVAYLQDVLLKARDFSLKRVLPKGH